MTEQLLQHGYLVLADISGYTSYLAGTELDHAHEILSDLLETIVGSLKSLLTISKLEGDAVFGYVAEARVGRGETLFELVESKQVEPKEAYMRSVDKGSFINKLREKGFDTSYADTDPITAGGPPAQGGGGAKPGAAGVRR